MSTWRDCYCEIAPRECPVHGLVDKVVQYRKVGTFRVLRPDAKWEEIRKGDAVYQNDSRLDGWYDCEPVKVPKKYRLAAELEGGSLRLWIDPRNVQPIEISLTAGSES